MTKHETMLNRNGIGSPFVIRHSSFRGVAAFTLLELLIVMTIIIILAGLTFTTMGYVQGKAKRSRAEAEIAAFSAALESYKADNGAYPSSQETNDLNPTSAVNPTAYSAANLKLYEYLSGDVDHDRKPDTGAKSYFSFKPNQLTPSDQTKSVTGMIDPFGNNYGYSTSKANGGAGYNPTFDLWSTAGADTAAGVPGWTKNW